MKDFNYNRWLIGFIVLGLAAALAVCFTRHKVEENNTIVEMAIDYEGLVELAEVEGVPVDTVLKEAKAAGITSLAVYETTLEKLNASGKVGVSAGSEILRNYHSGSLVDAAWRAQVEDGTVRAENVYVTQNDARVFDELRGDLIRRLGQARVADLTVGNQRVLAVKANYEKAVKWNMGMPRAEMQAVNDAGFYVIARPSNYDAVSADDVRAVFDRLEGIDVSDVVFSGEAILGYPDFLTDTANFMRARNLTLGMIEHPLQLQFYKQEGLIELASALDFRAARVYTIPKDEQPKLKIAAAVDRWVTTDEERNIRINLLRAYEKPEGAMTLLETNMRYFSATRDALLAKGFTIGKAGVYADYYPSRLLIMMMAMGAAAAGVLYLSQVMELSPRKQYLLLLVISALLIAPLVMGQGKLVRSAVALAAANLFPAISMIWLMDRVRGAKFDPRTPIAKVVLSGAAALLATSALSFIGGAYVGGVLADVEYLLEVNIFRGVKLTFVLPIVLVSIAFLQRFHLFDGTAGSAPDLTRQLKKVLNAPVYVKSLIAFGFAAIAAVVFVGRSGHTAGIPVPGIELKFRAFLEQALYARPRSKELLIGHPAFMLAALSLYRKWPTVLFFALVVLATIGQGSLVETFAHIRTPVFMSLARGLGGVTLGALIGAALVVVAHFARRWFFSAGRRKAKHE